MKKLIISTFDTQTKVFYNPWYAITRGEAIRSFSDAVNDPQSLNLNKHPEDFILYVIGEYEDSSGLVSPVVPPSRLGIGTDFVKNGVKELVH